MMVLIICGLVVGLALVGSDLINPISNWAEAQRYQSETQRIDEQNTVDVKQYEALREAETQAEIRRLNEQIVHQEQLHQAEMQQLNEEMLHKQQMHEEELRQAREMAALKLRLLNTAGIILAVSIGISLIILSLGAIKRLWENPPHPSRLVQANLRPYQPSSQTPQTTFHPHSIHTGNGGSLQTP
jgi:TolA-binding protein